MPDHVARFFIEANETLDRPDATLACQFLANALEGRLNLDEAVVSTSPVKCPYEKSVRSPHALGYSI